jgi:hypothetical protein
MGEIRDRGRERASEADRGVVDSGSTRTRVLSEGERDESAREREREKKKHTRFDQRLKVMLIDANMPSSTSEEVA